MAGCASLCFGDNKWKFWTYNPRYDKYSLNTIQYYSTSVPFLSQSVQVLDEDFRPRKESIFEGVSLWTESMRSSRWFEIFTRASFCCRCFGRIRESPPSDLHERKTIEVAKGTFWGHFFDPISRFLAKISLTKYLSFQDLVLGSLINCISAFGSSWDHLGRESAVWIKYRSIFKCRSDGISLNLFITNRKWEA